MILQYFYLFFVGYLGCQVYSMPRKAMQNKHIKMAAVPFPPYLAQYTDKNNKTRYTGLLWDMAHYIEKARNCTFEVMVPADQMWGNCACPTCPTSQTNCSGMIGMVVRGEADFALGPGILLQK